MIPKSRERESGGEWSLNLERELGVMDIPLKAEHSTVSYSLHHDHCGRGGEREEKEEETTAQVYMLCVTQPHMIQLVGYLPSAHFLLEKKKSRLRELKIKQTTCPMLSALLYYNVEWKRIKLIGIFREEQTGWLTIRVERCTNLWVEAYVIRSQFNTMSL